MPHEDALPTIRDARLSFNRAFGALLAFERVVEAIEDAVRSPKRAMSALDACHASVDHLLRLFQDASRKVGMPAMQRAYQLVDRIPDYLARIDYGLQTGDFAEARLEALDLHRMLREAKHGLEENEAGWRFFPWYLAWVLYIQPTIVSARRP